MHSGIAAGLKPLNSAGQENCKHCVLVKCVGQRSIASQ